MLTLLFNKAGSRVFYSLTCSSASYSYSGFTANLNRAYKLAANNGNYALTGFSANPVKAYLLSGLNGNYSVTGYSAVLNYAATKANYSLSCVAGVYSLIGFNADLYIHNQSVLFFGPGFTEKNQKNKIINNERTINRNNRKQIEALVTKSLYPLPKKEIKPAVMAITVEAVRIPELDKALELALQRSIEMMEYYESESDDEEALMYLL
jgi:acetamidase/formamidase